MHRLVLGLALIPLLVLAPLAGVDEPIVDDDPGDVGGYPDLRETEPVAPIPYDFVDVSGTWVGYRPPVTPSFLGFEVLCSEHTADAVLVLAARE